MTKYAQLQCKCGWKSQLYPKDTSFAGVGGQLSCPICTRLRRNRNIEVYGYVHVFIIEDDLDRVS